MEAPARMDDSVGFFGAGIQQPSHRIPLHVGIDRHRGRGPWTHQARNLVALFAQRLDRGAANQARRT